MSSNTKFVEEMIQKRNLRINIVSEYGITAEGAEKYMELSGDNVNQHYMIF